MYDVVKFQVKTEKKNIALAIAPTLGASGQTAYLLPYTTQKDATALKVSLKEAATIAEKYGFYTISTGVSEKNVSCPLMNDKGQVLGLIQKGTDTESYAMSADYAKQLSINLLSTNDYTLNNIGIMKGLPEDENQALVYLMTAKASENYIEQLALFMEKYPNNADGYLRRATYYVEQQEYEKAEADLVTYLEKDADKADAHYNIGFLIYNKVVNIPEPAYKDWSKEKALDEINTAIELKPNNPIYLKMKADILLAMNDFDNAYLTYEKLLDTDMKSPAVYSFMAECKTAQQAPEEEIIAILDKAMEEFTKPYGEDVAPYLYNRAVHKAAAGKYREAVVDFNDVEHIYGGRGSADFYLERARTESKCRMYQQALDDLKEACELAPQAEEPFAELATLQVTIKDYPGAVETAQHLINTHPESPYGYRFLGFAQANMGKKAEGKANLEKAKKLGDPNAETIIQRYCK
ncbi:MAG: serine protease [Bacteroidaceae bacterium]|nr:serine protease [Bacteroidaceae bacterium]